jgi:hypothetical protein
MNITVCHNIFIQGLKMSFRNRVNFPSPGSGPAVNSMSMPNDLLASGREYYTSIVFHDYRNKLPSGLISSLGEAFGDGFIKLTNKLSDSDSALKGSTAAYILPIPLSVNDTTFLNWSTSTVRESIAGLAPTSILGGIGKSAALVALGTAMDMGIGDMWGKATESFPELATSMALAASGLGPLIGAVTGKAINPGIFLHFQGPTLKQHQFTWLLAPRTEKESDTLSRMVNDFKMFTAPELSQNRMTMDYPYVMEMKMHPRDLNNHMKFKTMAVQGISVENVASPAPSFFEQTGAPTLVSLTMQCQEIELWWRHDYSQGGRGR